ncbi:hypothetical protein GWI33_019777 [Rhynchophorus ferrugineus]|uniref:Uncharacterized protein n=1 Tax=Rhynchophorus ferrugineus TaxID=354439 RepID=A0A834HQS0_RHYFE|nr:hypothetical protein GWI33_019777 [Rhynchophorus ferrugineus]
MQIRKKLNGAHLPKSRNVDPTPRDGSPLFGRTTPPPPPHISPRAATKPMPSQADHLSDSLRLVRAVVYISVDVCSISERCGSDRPYGAAETP